MRFLPNKSSGQQWRSGISNHQWPAVHKFGRQYVPEYHVGSWVMQWLVRSLDTPKPMHQRNWFHALPFLVQYLARHNRAHDACIAPAARPPNFGQGYSWRRFLLPPKGVNNQPKHIKGEDNVWIWIMTGRTSFGRSKMISVKRKGMGQNVEVGFWNAKSCIILPIWLACCLILIIPLSRHPPKGFNSFHHISLHFNHHANQASVSSVRDLTPLYLIKNWRKLSQKRSTLYLGGGRSPKLFGKNMQKISVRGKNGSFLPQFYRGLTGWPKICSKPPPLVYCCKISWYSSITGHISAISQHLPCGTYHEPIVGFQQPCCCMGVGSGERCKHLLNIAEAFLQVYSSSRLLMEEILH